MRSVKPLCTARLRKRQPVRVLCVPPDLSQASLVLPSDGNSQYPVAAAITESRDVWKDVVLQTSGPFEARSEQFESIHTSPTIVRRSVVQKALHLVGQLHAVDADIG